jgi:hypothetical protein
LVRAVRVEADDKAFDVTGASASIGDGGQHKASAPLWSPCQWDQNTVSIDARSAFSRWALASQASP